MSHVSDFTQSEDKIVLDLINFDNASNLTLAQVSIGEVAAGQEGRSAVVVNPIAGSGYSASQTVEYNRISIADYVDAVQEGGIAVQKGDAENMSDFLAEINTLLATNLTTANIVDAAVPAFVGTPNEVKTGDIVIAATSKVYTGQVTITINADDIALSTVITTTVLNGLNLPTGRENARFVSNVIDDI